MRQRERSLGESSSNGRHECRNLRTSPKPHNGNRRPPVPSLRFDARPGAPIEIPDEAEEGQEVAVEPFLATLRQVRARPSEGAAQNDAAEAEDAWRIQPYHRIRAGEPQIKSQPCIISFVYPAIARDSGGDPRAETSSFGCRQSGSQKSASRWTTGRLRRSPRRRARVDLPLPAFPRMTMRCIPLLRGGARRSQASRLWLSREANVVFLTSTPRRPA